MPDPFPLESNLFYLDLDSVYTPLVTRTRATDGSISTVELAPRTLWSAQDIKCRITTSAELTSFETFYASHRASAFLIYDPTHSNQYLEAVGTGTGSQTQFSLDHTYITSGTLEVYVNGALQTETTHYTVNYTTGVITFVAAPTSGHAVTASYRFRRLVVFDGGYTYRKRAIPDCATITSTQIGIISFDLLESVNA